MSRTREILGQRLGLSATAAPEKVYIAVRTTSGVPRIQPTNFQAVRGNDILRLSETWNGAFSIAGGGFSAAAVSEIVCVCVDSFFGSRFFFDLLRLFHCRIR